MMSVPPPGGKPTSMRTGARGVGLRLQPTPPQLTASSSEMQESHGWTNPIMGRK